MVRSNLVKRIDQCTEAEQDHENEMLSTFTNPPLASMFTYRHISDRSIPSLLLLALYFPIGVCLLLFRLVVAVILTLIFFLLPSSTKLPSGVMRLILFLAGIVVKQPKLAKDTIFNESNFAKQPIIACNHRTAVDVFPFLTFFHVKVLIDRGFFSTSVVSKQFQKVVGAVPIDKADGRETLRSQILQHIDGDASEQGQQKKEEPTPLLWFPEGWDTNGKTGIMVYQKFLFSIGKPVQPVAMKVHVPLLPIEPGMLGSSIFREVMWMLFSPCYIYELSFLDIQTKQETETDVQFARRIQEMTAKELGVVPTTFSFKDALQLRRDILDGKIKLD